MPRRPPPSGDVTRRAVTCAGLTLTSLLVEAGHRTRGARGRAPRGSAGAGAEAEASAEEEAAAAAAATSEGSIGGFLFVAIIIVFLDRLDALAGRRAARKYRLRRRDRDTRVRTAAAEAREDDVYFDPATVDAEAAALFHACQEAWDAVDHDRLRTLIGADLLKEWELRLHDFEMKGWRNEVTVRNGPAVEYVGLVNRDDDAEDRVVVRLEATLRDVVVTNTGEVRYRDKAQGRGRRGRRVLDARAPGRPVDLRVDRDRRRGRPPSRRSDRRLAVERHRATARRGLRRGRGGGGRAGRVPDLRDRRPRLRRRRPRRRQRPLPRRRPLRATRARGRGAARGRRLGGGGRR